MDQKRARSERATEVATEVEIFGAVYHVRGREDGKYLQGLARRVDRTMREIAERVSTVDTAKIAILTALNLADELSKCQTQDGERVEIEKRVAGMAAELSEALEG